MPHYAIPVLCICEQLMAQISLSAHHSFVHCLACFNMQILKAVTSLHILAGLFEYYLIENPE